MVILNILSKIKKKIISRTTHLKIFFLGSSRKKKTRVIVHALDPKK